MKFNIFKGACSNLSLFAELDQINTDILPNKNDTNAVSSMTLL